MSSVDVVIPVLNELQALPGCIDELRAFLGRDMKEHKWRIVIADNGSTDGTLEIAKACAKKHPRQVRYLHLDERGRGRALRRAWLDSSADVVSYMDVDLSTRLEAFPLLVNAVAREGYDVAIGSRLARGSRTVRSLKRELISRAYNQLIRFGMRTHFSDAQCGFKALSREAARSLVPRVVDNGWFFDTELLVIAEKSGFAIKDIPVEWEEDPDTRVKVARTALDDLRGLARLRLGGVPHVDPPRGRSGDSRSG